LLGFHEFIDRLQIIHADVQIKLFRYSLEGISLDWCRSLPDASVISLVGFHAAFNSFCKEYFPAEHLFEGCCEEFSSYHKDLACHKNQISDKDFIIEEDIHLEDQEVLNDCNDIETSDIISDVSIVLEIHENQHISFECFEVKEKMYTSAGGIDKSASDSFESAVDDEGSLQFLYFQEPSNLQLEKEDLPYPYEYVVSNYDEEQGEIFSNMFHHPSIDTSLQEASSLLLGSHLDAPIFDQYSDEEEDVKVCEDILFNQISSSSTFHHKMIKNMKML
jgi:hypothetical protein